MASHVSSRVTPRIFPPQLILPDAYEEDDAKVSKVANDTLQSANRVKRTIRAYIADPNALLKATLEKYPKVKFIYETDRSILYRVTSHEGKEYVLKAARGTVQQEELRSENRTLSNLNHPNIIKPISYSEDETNAYMLLELARGDFFDLKNDPITDEREIYGYFSQIVSAIQHLHDNDIMHRDIKPENILIMMDGTLKLTDFGFAKRIDGPGNYSPKGTSEYLSPDFCNSWYGKPHDHWNLGIWLYEMIFEKTPFIRESDKQLSDRYKKFEIGKRIIRDPIVFPENSQISDKLRDLILMLLQKDPDHRLGNDRCCQDIFDHPWMAQFNEKAIVPPEEDLLSGNPFELLKIDSDDDVV